MSKHDPTAPTPELFQRGCESLSRDELVELAYEWRLHVHRLTSRARSVSSDLGENIARSLEDGVTALPEHLVEHVIQLTQRIRGGDSPGARSEALRLQAVMDRSEPPDDHRGIVMFYRLAGKLAMFLAVTAPAHSGTPS